MDKNNRVYEVETKKGEYEYEVHVAADSGKVIRTEKDRDDDRFDDDRHDDDDDDHDDDDDDHDDDDDDDDRDDEITEVIRKRHPWFSEAVFMIVKLNSAIYLITTGPTRDSGFEPRARRQILPYS